MNDHFRNSSNMLFQSLLVAENTPFQEKKVQNMDLSIENACNGDYGYE